SVDGVERDADRTKKWSRKKLQARYRATLLQHACRASGRAIMPTVPADFASSTLGTVALLVSDVRHTGPLVPGTAIFPITEREFSLKIRLGKLMSSFYSHGSNCTALGQFSRQES